MRIRLLSVVLLSALLITVGTAALADAPDRAFIARLSGEAPGVITEAWGHAVFNLSADGTALHYSLIVHHLYDPSMAHIHLAPPGQNGPITVWLYPAAPPAQPIPGRFDGVLGTGTITDANLVGPLEGMTLQDLLAAMSAGNTYVNVHTAAYPGGEIRGQIGTLNP